MKNLNKVSYLTSEAVSASHPDKVMDAIVERLLYFNQTMESPLARFAMDGMIKCNQVHLAGEVTNWNPEKESCFRSSVLKTLDDLGYGQKYLSTFMPGREWDIQFCVTPQSSDIAQGVDRRGAGDNGIMYGYASDETSDCTFAPFHISRYIAHRLWSISLDKEKTVLRPDIKVLTTMRYVGTLPVAVEKVVACISHEEGADYDDLGNLVRQILKEVCEVQQFDDTDAQIVINPTGAFSLYGPVADSGLVGRKIVCDQYGGATGCPVGGGNLNGKDFTKVDRSGVYMARHIAKSIVHYGLARKAVVQLSYAIGVPEAVSVNVEVEGAALFKKFSIRNLVDSFDTSVGDIIEKFDLYNMSLRKHDQCGQWGHIGVPVGSPRLPWEIIH